MALNRAKGKKLKFLCANIYVVMRQGCILTVSELCSCGVKAMFLCGRNHIFAVSKLCFQCCNAIEKDRSLRRE